MKRALLRSLSAFFALIMLLSLSACGDKPDAGNTSPSTPAPTGNAAGENADEALTSLRELMRDNEQMALAAAYLGYREEADTSALSGWLWTNMPGLTEVMPFMRFIPPERILGGESGDLYCVVPRDGSTSLAVNRVKWVSFGDQMRPKTSEVLYRSENAEPLLIFVSRGQSSEQPEIEINAVAGNGASVTWYPVVDADSGEYNVPTGEDQVALILDFSRFGDIGGLDYGDDGWFPPTDEGLADTVWSFGRWELKLSRGGSDPDYSGKAELLYQDTDGAEYKSAYSGVWRMENDCLRLELSAGVGTSLSGSFPVYIDLSGEHLMLHRDGATHAGLPFFDDDANYMELTLSYG